MNYGKFNSAEELLKGYEQLEKSFTQKCQQLALIQKQQEQQGTSESSPPQTQTEEVAPTIPQSPIPLTSAPPTEQQLQQYLEQNPRFALKLLQQQTLTPTAPTVITGGGVMSLALPSRPTTIREATLMAKKLFE